MKKSQIKRILSVIKGFRALNDEKKYFVYIIECENGNYYTGYSTDIEKRFDTHKNRERAAARYTKSFKAVKIAACWIINGLKGDALRVELFIKKHRRSEKEKFIFDPEMLCVRVNERFDGAIAIENFNFLKK